MPNTNRLLSGSQNKANWDEYDVLFRVSDFLDTAPMRITRSTTEQSTTKMSAMLQMQRCRMQEANDQNLERHSITQSIGSRRGTDVEGRNNEGTADAIAKC